MISSYDPNFRGVHTIRVTFMQWDYTGHVSFEIGGNCKGAELLDFTFLECDNQEDIDRYSENDCQFSYDEENAGGANPCAVAYGRGRVFQH
jgi:hypothetical protein